MRIPRRWARALLGGSRFWMICGAGLQRGDTTVIRGKQTIHGMGGVDKTRAAVEYGWTHEADYNALLFVAADSPERLRANLAALCGPLVLNLPEQERAS